LERQRVERVVEEWVWRGEINRHSAAPSNSPSTTATSPEDHNTKERLEEVDSV
jgi:hypothetical protein